jgi:hypothetical protein
MSKSKADKSSAVFAALHQKELARRVKQGSLDENEAGKLRLSFEYTFAAKIKRKWRLDCVNLHTMTGVEIDGAVFKGKYGGHTSGVGYTKNREKDVALAVHGFGVFRITTAQMTEELVRKFVDFQLARIVIEAPNGDRWVFYRFGESVFKKK